MQTSGTHDHLRDLSDESLWKAYVDGHDEAFAEVRRRYQGLLFRYLALSLNDVRAAAQQLGTVLCMAAAWRKPYEGFDSLKGWLLAVATQQVVPAHWREDHGLTEFLTDLKRREPVSAAEQIRHALADMKREERQPFLLVVAGGLSIAEAAKACRFTPDHTVRLIARACREFARSGVFSKE